MRLIFFDEVKNCEQYPYYHIGGVSIEEKNLEAIESKMFELSDKVFGSGRLAKGTEFHAAEIYHRKKAFKGWSNFQERIDLLEELVRVLSLPEIELIDIQINCEKLSSTQSPEKIAFMFLCERANNLNKCNKSLGMLIGDRESDRVSEKHAKILSDYKDGGTDFAFGCEINHLVDSVHFTHSHLSRFLQLADVYAWILQFRNRNHNSENPHHQGIFKILKSEEIDLFPSKYKEWPK